MVYIFFKKANSKQSGSIMLLRSDKYVYIRSDERNTFKNAWQVLHIALTKQWEKTGDEKKRKLATKKQDKIR